MKNPKTHDALFKWLITSFTEEFFQHYFPQIPIGQYRFIDYEIMVQPLRKQLQEIQAVLT